MSTELPEELPAGFEFGSYVIHSCIGRGGMARVYRAEQAALRRPVALKVLDRWVLDEPSGMERFVREARAAASIKHPNVVDILDVGVWHERPYIVMEMLVGCDLDTHLDRRKTLTEDEIAQLALPVIAGMMAVHDAGVVHRDLKPSNIFLSNGPEGEIVPKVLDFGVSKFSNNLMDPIRRATKTREIVGTPAYMAPEALNGVRELGPAADQYALGAVLYECAVGRPPFEGETLLELLKAVAVGKIERPSSIRRGLSSVLEGAILRAISADPVARFESLRDMGRALWPLADARTRMIWERSFGGGARAGTSSDNGPPTLKTQQRSPAPESGGTARLARALRPSWVRPLAVAAALATVAALGSVWIYRSNEEPVATSTPAAKAVPPSQSVASPPTEPPSTPAASSEHGPAGTGKAQPADEARTRRATAALRRDPNPPRASRSSNRVPRRRTPTRPRAERAASARQPASSAPVASAAGMPRTAGDAPEQNDNELEGLFIEPPESPTAGAARGRPGELEGLFPQQEPVARSANDAPIPE